MNEPPSIAPDRITRVGDVVAGKFLVERILGEGGMGVVVAAKHIQLDERVALKFLRPGMSNPEMVARFAQEARAAVKLKSEHVARVIDVGLREDGVPFIVMEYLQGKDLSELLLDGGPLPIEAAAELVIQACEGLAEAHARGIVHRDIKPENLFLAEHGDGWRTLKILDFGISKTVLTGSAVAKGDSNIRTQQLMGSPCYMSPEQLRSTQSVDHRTDLWSMGIVLFELLTGTSAYTPEQTLSEVIAAILEQVPPRLRTFLPDAPAALDRIVDHCLQQDRERRFQNAAELAVALMPFAPKRARVKVERAVAVTRAAGLSDGSLVVPSSIAPPPDDGAPLVLSSNRPAGRSSRGPTAVPAGRGATIGKYRLVASLSHSSMWDVFLAKTPERLAPLTIVKRLRQPLAADPAFRATFLAQARLARGLDHPLVVRTLDVAEEGSAAFFVTEYVESQPLDAVVWAAKRSAARLAPLLSTRIVADVCAALAHAHEPSSGGARTGVIHHHLTPRNVLLTYEGAVKVVDFGVALAARQSPDAANLLRETSGYAAPEQLGKASIEPRADLYSAGVILWELLADRRLVRGDVSDTALQRFAAEPVPNLTELVNDVEPALAAIVARAVHKTPAERFQTAREMQKALEDYLATKDALPAELLGEQLQAMFGLPRQQLQLQIDDFVERASREPPPEVVALQTVKRHDSLADTVLGTHTSPFGAPADAPVAIPSVPPRQRPRRGTWVAVAVVALLVGVVATEYVLRSGRAQRSAASTTPSTATVAPAPSSAPDPSASVSASPPAQPLTPVVAPDTPSPPDPATAPTKRPGSAPAARPRPASSPQPTQAPADPGLDIRMHR